MFHMHEEVSRENNLSPQTLNGTTIVLGLFSDNPDALFTSAVSAGAREVSPMQDYEYGYRQGSVRDPFGHQWQLQRKIALPVREWV
jgi:PhnB protein